MTSLPTRHVSVAPGRALRLIDHRAMPLGVLLLLSIAVLAGGLVTENVLERQKHRMLGERAGDIEAIVLTSFGQSRTSLEAVAVTVSSNSDVAAFERAASPLVAPNRSAVVTLVGADPTGLQVRAQVGAFASSEGLSPAARQAVERAIAKPGEYAATGVVAINGERRFGSALRTNSLPPGSALYSETRLRPFDTASITETSPYHEVRVGLYAGFQPSSDQIIFNSGERLPLSEPTVTREMAFGQDRYLLVINARRSLIGGLADALPLMLLGGGLVMSALAAALVHILQRRRQYAMTLVEERTEALEASMLRLQERAELDALLRRATQQIGSAGDVGTAMDRLHALLVEIIPVDRVSLLTAEADGQVGARVLAVAGPEADELPVGTVLPIGIGDAVEENVKGDWATILGLKDATSLRGMRSIVSMPVIAGGESKADVVIATREGGAYRAEHMPILEAIARETSGAINQLLVIERERAAAQRAQALDQLKSEFVGIVAHDLRSPMTVIAGFADLLRIQGDRINNEQRQEYLGRISTNVKQLAEFVEDVLQVARIESGEMTCEIQPFDLGRLVQRTVTELCDSGNERQCVLEVPDDLPLAFADEQRQWQVLSNLMGNAFKFSPAGAPIEVRVECVGDELQVAVRDHGIGISPATVHSIFEKFSRVPQAGGGNVPGTGLGLYIARSLVEAQGGRITVESEIDAGSTFVYTVPTAPAQVQTASAAATSR